MNTILNKVSPLSKLSFWIGCCILGLMILLSSCKSQKLAIVDKQGKLVVRTQNKVFEDIIGKEYDYNTISAKGKVSVMGKELTTIFKIKKDSILQASVRPLLGIEVLRLDITPSRIVVIDRLKKQYAVVPLDQDIVASLGFNFYNLQSLFTNKLFLPGQKNVESKDYNKYIYSIQSNEYVLECDGKNSVNYLFTVDNLNLINQINVSLVNKDASMVWSYKNFVEDNNNITYPTQIDAKIKVGVRVVKVGVTYPKLDIDTNISFDTSIPSSYSEHDMKDLIKDYIK